MVGKNSQFQAGVSDKSSRATATEPKKPSETHINAGTSHLLYTALYIT